MPYYRSVFISDLHLGSAWCQTGELMELMDFLSVVEYDKLYLIGDIFDDCRPARFPVANPQGVKS
jgi:UDP-2,3-diacylglucosamine pyrophosphatase LpxH